MTETWLDYAQGYLRYFPRNLKTVKISHERLPSMCGLVVIYQPDSSELDLASLARMTHTLTHRGPDDYGFCVSTEAGIASWKDRPPNGELSAGVAMGHRRLSILDLSEAGRQPFISADGRYALAYNGEVYNYRELRTELEALGLRFQTRTDTEVVLSAYAHWGTECFRRFNGMWAVVIWDKNENTLVACRDRFGVKPLYFQRIGHSWIFASEVKAILQHPAAKRGVDHEALVSYLMDLGNPRADQTFFDGVDAIAPGSYMLVTPRSNAVRRYWDLPNKDFNRSYSIGEAAAKLEELLRDAVTLRMRSDVRIGTMLSGGLDSTSVISMVRCLMDVNSIDHQVTGDILQGFTAIYRDSEINEEPLVDELCRSLNVRANKVFPIQEQELQELLYTAAWHMERPYFNSVPLVHTLLMRKARSLGVIVVLNGHGPDEMLAGYPAKYIPEAIGDSIFSLRWDEALRDITSMRDMYGLGRKKALQLALESRIPRSLRYRRLRNSASTSPLLRQSSRQLINARSMSQNRTNWRGGLDRSLQEDFFCESLPNWLHLEDRISMSASIEARLPFLDYRIVEFAFSLPNRLKIENGVTKRVLREAMKGYLPDSIISSFRKVPFSGPDSAWVRGPLRPWIENTFLKGDAKIYEYLEPAATRALFVEFLGSTRSRTHQYRVWKLINAELWMQSFF